MSQINYHLQALIELAYKTDRSSADYHVSRLTSEISFANLNERDLKILSSQERFKLTP